MTFRRRAIAVATGFAYLCAPTVQAGPITSAGRSQVGPVPPSSEAGPGGPVSQPSGVQRRGAGATPSEACAPGGAAPLPFRITIDGQPLDAGEAVGEADRQRCADIALAQADIQVRYDGFAVAPALNAWTSAAVVAPGQPVEFRAWSNYIAWIAKAEVRIFGAGQSSQDTPLAVVPVGWSAPAQWQVPADAGERPLAFLLRVYDAQGRFDETTLKPLPVSARAGTPEAPDPLAGYGENTRSLANITVRGGTVTVNGSRMKAGQRIEALGVEVPVDTQGRFALKQILPSGPHAVEITLREADGRAATFRRNLSIPADDWFYIALGDLTVGRNNTSGPARLVTGDLQHYDDKVFVDGRAAFYLKGKIKGDWLLTASADTRERPLKDLFSNFSAKDPRYLLRNIDPDQYYPVYGDDSTTVDDAPTQGKFFVRLQKDDTQVMWGNFQTAWTGTELLQYSRGLYGASLRHRSEGTTSLGERRTQLDAFVADPGTLGAREEFRSTGGSLYYLRHLDVVQGSERVWVEVRDKDSGRVLQRRELAPVQDYEINYLQGRLLLQSPLSMTGAGGGVVMTSSLGGHPVYLVTTYEFVPGVTAVDNLSTGLRASQWLNDHLRFGITTFRQGEGGARQSLQGIDATLRYKPGTWVRVERAQSSGAGTTVATSVDGGFGFDPRTAGGTGDASATFIEAQADLREVTGSMDGKLGAYRLDKDRGYSAPGQVALGAEAVRQQGVNADIKLTLTTTLLVKADERNGEQQDSRNVEVGVRQALGSEWEVTVAARADERTGTATSASPLLSQTGSRTDAQARLAYKPDRAGGRPGEKEPWDLYGFVQGTVRRDGTREPNDRLGAGGSWQVLPRLRLAGEVSGGSLGPGGKLAADYQVSERSTAYLTYALESETDDMAWRGRQGTLVSGMSTRVSEEMRLFGENRNVHGAGPQSLTQAFGLEWSPSERWNWGAKVEFGNVSDPLAGDLRRRAAGGSVGYRQGAFKYNGALEWRQDTGGVAGGRTTWLMRNGVGVQVDPSWRLQAKLNLARSSGSQGAFLDGDFTELVLASAWRPVDNDRWNTLFKYTNLRNVPTAGQLAPSGQSADYAQRSQVFAVDTIYALRPWVSVGAKYALRVGELRAPAGNGPWFDSRAQLVVLRADFHVVKEWDVLAEVRKLSAREARDARAGALVGVYRHVGNGVKVGAGYNFTSYSDDLTDLSYRSKGWFINVLATY